ncbi:GNAT family N-acetyltransferase [Natronosalvus rutilus]|uniref:GNAT family N-acetyltransferase n=1 Tax=Natronosalvus rutilus TaxID=2953753 RepID=A0A9E7N7T3_9EURY|nr:GNAT family N-acetyltransferase [Natronosalvus rutilus]UTF53282.1 GNAT family N-acetyltransferase [Natronosalvus rutilus]
MSHLFPDTIETDRLRLERLSSETVDPLAYYRICDSDPAIDDVTRHTPWDPHETPNETLEFLENREDAWNESRSADYVIRPLDSQGEADEIAGTCGLGVDWAKRTGDLGIWLRERFWGQGYSGERADALVTLAFDRLDLEVVSVLVQADNERSLRACDRYVERLGGSRDCRLRNWWTMAVDEPADAIRYTITRASYDPGKRRSAVSLEASR